MKRVRDVLGATLLMFFAAMGVARAADGQRQAEVASRGAEVMPFDLKATMHVFIKTDRGGIQRVVANDPSNTQQIELVRAHLRTIRQRFLKGDFSDPAHIHGQTMPGLRELEAAAPGQIAIQYRDLDSGAELTYESGDKRLVAALHAWFDAQRSDHGADAVGGDARHRGHGGMAKSAKEAVDAHPKTAE